MENGTLAIGFEDGTIDVEGMLVEPQDVHASMDVMCFNEKIPKNTMGIGDVSRSFGGTKSFNQEGKDLHREVLEEMANEDEVGYFRLQSDLCSIGDEYLLGVEFAESITNLDYGSSERLQTSVPDSLILSASPWKSDIFRMEVPELGNIHDHHECDTLATTEKSLKTPTSCTLPNIGKFHDISSCSFEEVLSDENDRSLSTSADMTSSPKIEKNDEFGLAVASKEKPDQERGSNNFRAQKRSRKPTQRYIDEFQDPLPRYPKKRQEVSSLTIKDKSLGVKVQKKCRTRSREVGVLDEEETSVKAIQVPFASLMHNECPESESSPMGFKTDSGNLMSKPKDNCVTSEIQKKRDGYTTPYHLKRRDDSVIVHVKKRSERLSQKRRDNWIITVSPGTRDERFTGTSQKKRVDCLTVARPKKRDDFLTGDNLDEVSGRRKHHILWTIAEVRKLLDGVSQYGVGRWSRIKKLFFSASAHRTSVDLKDKWRNLLKASGILDRSNRQGGKKRNPAWRPLPKSIICRVCELASMHPYPKVRKPKIAAARNNDNEDEGEDDSPEDRSADITRRDYRRILRSINGN